MSINVNNTNQTNQAPFLVNQNGAIEIESLKNKSIYDIAQKYDNTGLDNELLEGNELTGFLKEVMQDEVMRTYLNITQDSDKYTYYQQKDSNGNWLKKCIATKTNSSTMSFVFKNGIPKYCTTTMANGEKDVINLDTGLSLNYKTSDSNARCFKLTAGNCKLLKRLAQDKPAGGITEIFYRISNWDWDNW